MRVLVPLQRRVLKEFHQDGKDLCFPKEYDTEKKGHEKLAAKSYSGDTINEAVLELLPTTQTFIELEFLCGVAFNSDQRDRNGDNGAFNMSE